MTRPAIIVESLSKQYRIGVRRQGGSFREAVVHALKAPGRRRQALRNGEDEGSFWALKDVSFNIERGSVVGVIGRNGAGKSTLLKILSRITEPTSGKIRLRGRLASLLEVGTGFHPELTGRENVYLNGAILGMRKGEIDRKFDQIVAFAEVEKFLDTPVKHYSSGMYVRLAFAVAAHLEPDILVVDEVLAVGDAAFQDKCLGRIQEVSRGEGRTVLFVSHNMGAVARLCNRAIWLDAGRVVADETADVAVKRYLSLNLLPSASWSRPTDAANDSPVRFTSVTVRNDSGDARSSFSGSDAITVEMVYEVSEPIDRCQIGVRVVNGQALPVFTTADSDTAGAATQPRRPGVYRTSFMIPAHFLPPECYVIHVAAHQPFNRVFDAHKVTARFEVTNVNSLVAFDNRAGAVAPLLQWKTRTEHHAVAIGSEPVEQIGFPQPV